MKDTRLQTRGPLFAEDKISIALQGLRGEDSSLLLVIEVIRKAVAAVQKGWSK
ncbi:hypothetical protein [Bradyrhizobium sacchari]|uniref:Uncharacterized protein n=1 Tax=Bradyrhizobium sacchari TaxID=1399419 RepID=A0A560I6F5_9BRAD|nr:hypothetical protein [Bradyrhizobium sacchari]TWB52630.1 hypothetical protein FBZ94_109355 [Bradyrhizobium sacchari]TWB70009.1 hypothetical protein FBZ95_1087 [Bradyrhizobium sacchari]